MASETGLNARPPSSGLGGEPLLQRHWFDPICGWLAFALPLGLTLLRASPATQWRDDLSIVRGLGFVPLAGEGTLSSVLMQLFALMPLGGRLLRASFVSAFGLGLCAWLLFVLARRVLEANAHTPRLSSPLALSAALTATLAPSWQLEGTIAGGATLAAALALAGLLVRPRADSRDARVWLGVGALTAAAACESHAAGIALFGALAAQIAVLRELPPRRGIALFGAAAALVVALCLVPLLVRPFAPHAWVHLGFSLSGAAGAPVGEVTTRSAALTAWFREVGVVACALALGGGLWGLIRRRTRWLVVPLLVFVVADAVFPGGRASLLVTDALASLRVLAVGALAVCAVLGVHALALGLQRARIPMARQAAALLVVFQFTLVLVTADDSAFLADRRAQHGAEVWTDEALGGLPRRSLMLVRSEAVAWRLWAAWVVRGERPDAVVVPLPLLERGSVAGRLIALEPALTPLVRELAISDRPSEYALSTLADARPLFVEVDPSWDPRLFEHLVPHPLWLRFSPHALGRSDRNLALKSGRRAFRRVLGAALEPGVRDEATLAVLSARTSEQALVLAALGDRKSALHLIEDLKLIDPKHETALTLEKRLHGSEHRVSFAELLPELR